MKIAYIGIDLFLPALQILLQNGCELVELFTCETDDLTEFHHGVASLAKQKRVPYTTRRISVSDFERLQSLGCDAVICAGYYYKIPVYPALPTVNIHPSLLPYGRGGWPMPWDILQKREYSGVSIHKIAEGFDTGDILLQKSFALDETETLETFMQKVYACLPNMLSELLAHFDALYANARPQGEGVYLPMPRKEEYTVSRQTPFELAERIFRAFYGYDCYYRTESTEFRLIRALASKERPNDAKLLSFPIQGGYAVCERKNVLTCPL